MQGTCKRCGKPMEDMYYSKWNYCASCGKVKQRYDHLNIVARAFTILVSVPLLIGLIAGIIGIVTQFQSLFLIIYFATMFILGLTASIYTRIKIGSFEK